MNDVHMAWRRQVLEGHRLHRRLTWALVSPDTWSACERSWVLRGLWLGEEYEGYEEASRDDSAEAIAAEVAVGKVPTDDRLILAAQAADLAAELRTAWMKAARLQPRPEGEEITSRRIGGTRPRRLWSTPAGWFLVESWRGWDRIWSATSTGILVGFPGSYVGLHGWGEWSGSPQLLEFLRERSFADTLRVVYGQL